MCPHAPLQAEHRPRTDTAHVAVYCFCRVCYSAACMAACKLEHVPIGALKALALYEDSRPRVVKATKEWNWRPLVSVLEHEDVNLPLHLAPAPFLFAFHAVELPCILGHVPFLSAILPRFPFFLPFMLFDLP